MQTLLQLHKTHVDLSSEINFAITELKFLLKLVNKEYSICISNSKVKILDGYYVMFEQEVIKLLNLRDVVNKEEKDLVSLYTETKSDCYYLSGDSVEEEYRKICSQIKIVKESFYDYILNNK